MRGSFNDTLSVRYGPDSDSGPPGVVWSSGVPCRFVPQLEIDQRQFPFTNGAAWVTLDAVDLHGPLTTYLNDAVVRVNYGKSDQISVDHMPGVWFYIAREEFVHPYGRTSYHRWLLLPINTFPSPPPPPPPPPPTPTPGTSCATAGTLLLGQHAVVTYQPGIPSNWWRVVIPADGTYRYVITINTPSNTALVHGTCDSFAGIGNVSGSGCLTFTATTGEVVYIAMSLVDGLVTYDVVIEEGACAGGGGDGGGLIDLP